MNPRTSEEPAKEIKLTVAAFTVRGSDGNFTRTGNKANFLILTNSEDLFLTGISEQRACERNDIDKETCFCFYLDSKRIGEVMTVAGASNSSEIKTKNLDLESKNMEKIISISEKITLEIEKNKKIEVEVEKNSNGLSLVYEGKKIFTACQKERALRIVSHNDDFNLINPEIKTEKNRVEFNLTPFINKKFEEKQKKDEVAKEQHEQIVLPSGPVQDEEQKQDQDEESGHTPNYNQQHPLANIIGQLNQYARRTNNQTTEFKQSLINLDDALSRDTTHTKEEKTKIANEASQLVKDLIPEVFDATSSNPTKDNQMKIINDYATKCQQGSGWKTFKKAIAVVIGAAVGFVLGVSAVAAVAAVTAATGGIGVFPAILAAFKALSTVSIACGFFGAVSGGAIVKHCVKDPIKEKVDDVVKQARAFVATSR